MAGGVSLVVIMPCTLGKGILSLKNENNEKSYKGHLNSRGSSI